MYRSFFQMALLVLASTVLSGCSSSEPPAAPVSETEVDDLELDLEGGVEATPEQATQSTSSD